MQEKYHEIYESLYDDYVYEDNIRGRYLRHGALFIRDAIERAIGSLGIEESIRPDAKHVLLVNFHQMVFLPLQYGREKVDYKKIQNDVSEDIHNVLERAMSEKDTQVEETRSEISGHDVIGIINDAWQDLKTLKLDVWG